METRMKHFVVLLFLIPVLFGCNNTVDLDPDPELDPDPPADITVIYSAVGPDVSRLLQWQWDKREDGSLLELRWIFKNDATISVIHCCGLAFEEQFSYLLCGNVLVTYGNETDTVDKIEATVFTMADGDVSFDRHNGTRFIRGEADDSSSADSPVVLENDLLGTWQGEDGTVYEFSSDTGLRITSPSGSGQYGYLVRNAEVLTLGPLVDGETAVVLKYQFTRTGNQLYLKRPDGSILSLTASLSE